MERPLQDPILSLGASLSPFRCQECFSFVVLSSFDTQHSAAHDLMAGHRATRHLVNFWTKLTFSLFRFLLSKHSTSQHSAALHAANLYVNYLTQNCCSAAKLIHLVSFKCHKRALCEEHGLQMDILQEYSIHQESRIFKDVSTKSSRNPSKDKAACVPQ